MSIRARNTTMPFPRPTDALIVIDPQRDFCPGGALAVAGGDEIMAGIEAEAADHATIIVTQDWHPRGHSSFASSHGGAASFSATQMPYGEQILWPDHCVQGTSGADFHPGIAGVVSRANLILRKGMNPAVDSYSAFFENDRKTATGLAGYLREKGVRRCVFAGLAYDYCVAYSALDAVALGFEAEIRKDLTRAIAMPLPEGGTSVEAMERRFRETGVLWG
jgi:nicotinamidase/pyrazinamidase